MNSDTAAPPSPQEASREARFLALQKASEENRNARQKTVSRAQSTVSA
ncbi:hypothetical protein SAMN05444156_1664 [Verrucomicrobium sp. GAS474]|nr:hypothetical protein [Verrucomicrobium sp. GAS474]SDU04919.1 hypothetical protein SAMN05444156_1664 [Verrucomicrobium sp. GAS474]